MRGLLSLLAVVPSLVAAYAGSAPAAGAMAVAVSLVIFIPQAARIWSLRRDAVALSAVSATTYTFMVYNAAIWAIYGALLGEFWVAAPGLLNFPLAVFVLWMVTRTRRVAAIEWAPLALIPLTLAAVPVAGSGGIGAAAAVSSVVLFIPQARLIARLRHNVQALRSVSVPTYALMVADAINWAIYAWLLREFWVAASGLVTLPLAVVVLVTVWRTRRRYVAPAAAHTSAGG